MRALSVVAELFSLMQLHLPQFVSLHDTVASYQDQTNCLFQFTSVVYHIIIISYHRTCYGANPPELNSALHT